MFLFAKCYRSVSKQAQPKPDLSFSPSSHKNKKTANSPPFLKKKKKIFYFLAKESQEWPWATYYINHVDNMKNDRLLLIGKRGEEKARGMNSRVVSAWKASGNSHTHVFLPQYLVLIISTAHFSSRKAKTQECGLCVLRMRERLFIVGKVVREMLLWSRGAGFTCYCRSVFQVHCLYFPSSLLF